MIRPGALVQLAAAVLLTAAATLALPSAPAQAVSCAAGQVTALVDYGVLGGGTATGCGSGSTADKAFTSAGFSLSQGAQQPGVVCRVDGKPSQGSCFATNAYWGFFVAQSGKGWVYASQGVYSQAVKAGDSVALVWQCGGSTRPPGQPSACHADAEPTDPPLTAKPRPQPKPTKQPTKQPTKRSTPSPSVGATTQVPSASASAAPTASRTAKPRPKPTASVSTGATTSAAVAPTQTPSSSDTPAASATTEAATQPTASDSGGGLPGWVAPVIVGLLAVVAGAFAWIRRAR